MKKHIWMSAAMAFSVAALTARGADVSGKITLKGTPPPEKVIEPLKNDAMCGKMHTEVPKTRLYVVAQDGGLADVIVYVKEGLPAGKTYDAPASAVELDQVKCEYQPYVFAMQAKQKLVIKNSDPLLHNINSTPKVPGNKPFNEAQAGNGPNKEKTSFTAQELFVPFQCNVHPWMYAYGNVIDHPYFSLSAKDGSFKIGNLPPGKYVIEAAHRKAGKVTKEITVGNDNQTVDLALEIKPAEAK
jgi:hypothetical protein